jgi:hypothetical protein
VRTLTRVSDATDDAGSPDQEPEDPSASVMDTQAFKRFYLEEPAPPPRQSFLQRLFGWLPGRGS